MSHEDFVRSLTTHKVVVATKNFCGKAKYRIEEHRRGAVQPLGFWSDSRESAWESASELMRAVISKLERERPARTTGKKAS